MLFDRLSFATFSVLQPTLFLSLPRARAGSRSPGLQLGQVMRGPVRASARLAIQPFAPLTTMHVLVTPAAAVSTNKDEWLRGTAADPKLRKKSS
jgi:hypothetical protein